MFSDTLISNCYWIGNESITTYVYNLEIHNWVHIPNSSVFNQGMTPTTWVLDEAQYGTTDLVEALNAGAMGQCTWLEDVDGENDGLPIFGPLDPNRVDEIAETPFQVYPNPTNGVLFVETRRTTSLPAATEYRITNLMGQTLQSGRIMGDHQQLDVSALPAGMNLLTVDGATMKFVVQ